MKQTGKCLTAEGGGTFLDQWDCVGTGAAPHQSWTLDVLGSTPAAYPPPPAGPVEPPQSDVTYKGRLRNVQFNTKCLRAVGGDNGAELEVVDCSASNADQLLNMDSFQVKLLHVWRDDSR